MYMTEYETTVVLRPDMGGDAVETVIDRMREVVRGQGGKLLSINHWGKKRLAYEIDKQTRGIYVNTHFLGPSGLVSELERNLRISDSVMRYLTVRMADKIRPDEREEREYVKPAYDVEEPVHEEVFTAPRGAAGSANAREDDEGDADADDADADFEDDKNLKA